nr:hypothetical protein [Xylella fastidiosa]
MAWASLVRRWLGHVMFGAVGHLIRWWGRGRLGLRRSLFNATAFE